MENNESKPLKPLSASRIKAFESCSWLYYCIYHLKLPQRQNDGARKGSVSHGIFEILLNKKHSKHLEVIIKSNYVTTSKPIERLIKIYMKKEGLINSPENFSHICQMILVGLKNDFLVKGGLLVSPEYRFEVLNESPRYLIKGFIDKPFIKGKTIIIDDFKSSKKKFEGEDRESNLQAMIYSLAAKKIWPKLKPIVRFIFLQYPDNPIMKLVFNENTLKGLEHYLADIQKRVDSFNEKDAKSNFAYHQPDAKNGEFKSKLMCGFAKSPDQKKKDGTKMWHCPFKFPFNYYVIKKENKILKTIFEEDKDKTPLKQGETIGLLRYNGCPIFNNDSLDGLEAPKFIDKKYSNVLEDFS